MKKSVTYPDALAKKYLNPAFEVGGFLYAREKDVVRAAAAGAVREAINTCAKLADLYGDDLAFVAMEIRKLLEKADV